MNSEVEREQLMRHAELRAEQKAAEEKADSQIVGEADLAKSFESHGFWQLMKRDLKERFDQLIIDILTDKKLNKEEINSLRAEARNIKLFLDSPLKYYQRLEQLKLKRRIR